MNFPRKQRGSAIIVALFVTSLVVIASVAMIIRLRMDVHDTELLINATQGNGYAVGSIAWAMEELNTHWKQKKPNKIVDKTPIQSPVSKINHAVISSTIYDSQGFFNINNVLDKKYSDDFNRLIVIVQPTIDQNTAQAITLAVVDWIRPDVNNTELNDYYLRLNPAYRAPHRPMTSVSELRLVRGVTPQLYEALSPYIIALPEVTQININNASIPVLMCISKTLTQNAAQAIFEKRNQTPFDNIQAFLSFDVIKNNPIPEEKITTISSYFLVKTHVKVEEQLIQLYTLLQRTEKNKQPHEVMLWQSKGTL